ncbi:MAG: 6,7-dimethyl-8-ribityllumazine synthase [Cytophagales bacterium]
MSSSNKNLNEFSQKNLIDISNKVIAIVVSEWNFEITEALFSGAFETLISFGAKKENIIRKDVPGSFELPLGALLMAEKKKVDAVICIGCVIQGETKHFDFISQATANGIVEVNLKTKKPIVFGVLTTDNLEQAKDRAGGKHGNKGVEAAVTAVKMLAF